MTSGAIGSAARVEGDANPRSVLVFEDGELARELGVAREHRAKVDELLNGITSLNPVVPS